MCETLNLCKQLIRTPSYGSQEGESEIIKLIQQILNDAGATNQRILTGQAGRPNLICELHSEKPGPTLILCSHVDVYGPEPERWTSAPLHPREYNDELWGAGASDAKGGVAAMLVATQRLMANGGPQAGKLVLAFTADEDHNGKWGLPWLVQNGYIQGDVAIAMAPAGFEQDYDGIPLAARGFISANIRITMQGGGFTSLYKPSSPHAVALAARLLTALEQDFRPTPSTHPLFPNGTSVVAGSTFSGGDFAGVLPEVAEFSLEVRLLPGSEPDSVLRQLKDFCRERIGDAEVKIKLADVWLGGYAGGCDLNTEHPLAIATLEAARSSGYRDIEFSGNPMYCEAAMVAGLGIPTLPALGPGSVRQAHQPDERASIVAIERSTEILSTLIGKILCPNSILD